MSTHRPNNNFAELGGYYGLTRHDVLEFIPVRAKRLLDVGCGEGATSLAAKTVRGVEEIIGVEIFGRAAEAARSKLDRVIEGDIETLELGFPEQYFDCILCADVLEHTKDPWSVLGKLHKILRNDGVLILSMPNVRHIVPVMEIILDRLEYKESGVLDRSHLRFFTLHTIKQMLLETGYSIQKVKMNRSMSWKFKIAEWISLGLMRPFSVFQFIILCNKR